MGKHRKNKVYDWRKDTQREEVWKILAPLGIILDISCILVPLLTIFKGGIWVWGGVLLFLVSMGLYLVFPQYFSILDEKKRGKTKAKVKDIQIPLMVSLVCVLLGCTEVKMTILNWPLLLGEMLVLVIILVALLCICSREVRESNDALLMAIILSIFLSFLSLHQGNHYLNMDAPPAVTYTIVEKDSQHQRRNRYTYEFVLQTAPGETMRLSVTGADYQNWEVGDEVPVCIDTGIFGIEYAYIPEP